jgi:hypothetical protein
LCLYISSLPHLSLNKYKKIIICLQIWLWLIELRNVFDTFHLGKDF